MEPNRVFWAVRRLVGLWLVDLALLAKSGCFIGLLSGRRCCLGGVGDPQSDGVVWGRMGSIVSVVCWVGVIGLSGVLWFTWLSRRRCLRSAMLFHFLKSEGGTCPWGICWPGLGGIQSILSVSRSSAWSFSIKTSFVAISINPAQGLTLTGVSPCMRLESTVVAFSPPRSLFLDGKSLFDSSPALYATALLSRRRFLGEWS